MRGRGVIGLFDGGKIGFADATDIADHMSKVLAERIMTREPRLDDETRKAEAIDRESREFLRRQIAFQGHTFEASRELELLLELLDLVVGQIQHAAQLMQSGVHIGDVFGHHGQRKRRTILGQQGTVATVDQATRRWQRQNLQPIVMRQGGEVIVGNDL